MYLGGRTVQNIKGQRSLKFRNDTLRTLCAGAYQNGAAIMVRPLWCGRYGAATMVCTIRCGDSMVLVFYGARQYGAMVRKIFCSLKFLAAFIRAVF